MKLFTAYFYYGRDRDDWISKKFASYDMTDALKKAHDMTPYGYNLWKVEVYDKDKENSISFNRYLNEKEN